MNTINKFQNNNAKATNTKMRHTGNKCLRPTHQPPLSHRLLRTSIQRNASNVLITATIQTEATY